MLRVTQVLEPYAGFENVPKWMLESAQSRGTKVHNWCLSLAKGIRFPLDTVLPDHQGYCLSFEYYKNNFVKRVLAVEPELEDEIFGFQGHPDLIVELTDNAIVIPDLKTAATMGKTWCGQLAAYWHLAKKRWPIDMVGSLMLNKDGGKPIFHSYDLVTEDFAAFIYLLLGRRHFTGE